MSVYNTEGIKYMGSKKEILVHIDKVLQNLPIKKAVDAFAGSTRVGQFFKNKGFDVISNDINIWSKTFALCYLKNKKPKSYYQKLIDELNTLPPVKGWFTENYGGANNNGLSVQADGKKRIWQTHVTEKLDAIRQKIEEWKKESKIDEVEEAVLLTSLILGLDKVDSSLGHQVSYLKAWSARSFNNLVLKVPDFKVNNSVIEVYQEDALKLCKKNPADLYYFDPPYGSNNDEMPSSRVRYGQYYHIWKSVILNDSPKVVGKINKRADADPAGSYSVFEDYKKDSFGKFLAQIAIEEMIEYSSSPYVLFSYNNNSRVPLKNIVDFLELKKYKYNIDRIDYKKNVMAAMVSTNNWANLQGKENYEVLIFVDKR